MPKVAPFVAVNPDTLVLYFDPLLAPTTALQDGTFTITANTAGPAGAWGSTWTSANIVEKWPIKKWAD